MTAVIMGGTSGLGLELARDMHIDGEEVYVTGSGRHVPTADEDLHYSELDLTGADLPHRIGRFALSLPRVDTLVYAAGYFQDGTVTELDDTGIENMLSVGGRGLMYAVQALLHKQEALPELVTVTSTSAWTPREREPVYNFVKAGAALFSQALSLDERIGKVLVAGPAGMDTDFWRGTGRNTSHLLPASWVAEQIMQLRGDDYSYRFARIMREPARVEIVETR